MTCKKNKKELYALLDIATLKRQNKTIQWFVKYVKYLNASIIQYRNKLGSESERMNDLLYIKSICNITLIVNDDIKLTKYADGLHLGQKDILKINQNKQKAIFRIREEIGSKLLGLSTHNKKEVLEANNFDINYIGLGAYRTTNTKNVNTILGDKIDYIASFSKKDVAIIGGVKLNDYFKHARYIVVGSGLYEN